MCMDIAKLFAEIRRAPFGGGLNETQVEGVEAIVAECVEQGADLPQAAYILATAFGETGGKMAAVRENLNYRASAIAKHFGSHRRQGYSPEQLARNPELLGNVVYGGDWGKQYLGNTEEGDGYAFRGWGIGQWTGRRNTKKVADSVGIDLLSRPELLDDIDLNAELLVSWMLEGNATGRRLAEYVTADRQDYSGARKVWGGVNPNKYASYARQFEAALVAAGYGVELYDEPEPVEAPPAPLVAPQRAPEPVAALDEPRAVMQLIEEADSDGSSTLQRALASKVRSMIQGGGGTIILGYAAGAWDKFSALPWQTQGIVAGVAVVMVVLAYLEYRDASKNEHSRLKKGQLAKVAEQELLQ